MPQIIVTAEDAEDRDKVVMLRERINASDFESDRFTTNLIERIAWAVDDATQTEARGTLRRLETEERDDANERDGAKTPRELVEA